MIKNRYRSNSGYMRMSYRGRSQYGQNYRGYFRKGNFRVMLNSRGQNFKGGYTGNFGKDNFGTCMSRDRQYSGNS